MQLEAKDKLVTGLWNNGKRFKDMKIYISGPITGLTYEQAWLNFKTAEEASDRRGLRCWLILSTTDWIQTIPGSIT